MEQNAPETSEKFYVRPEDMLRVGRELLVKHELPPEHAVKWRA